MTPLHTSILSAALAAAPVTGSHAPAKSKILLVASSTNVLELKHDKAVPTGYFLDELAVPAQHLIAEGYDVDVATPDGNTPAMDAHSDDVSLFGNDPAKLHAALKFVLTQPTMQKPLKLADVVKSGMSEYAAVYVPGGHAPMNDLMQDADFGRILRYFHAEQKPTALLCHGPVAALAALPEARAYRAALVAGDANAAKAAAKDWPYAGYRIAIFSNSEEQPIQKDVLKGDVQFYVADAIRTAGGKVEHGPDFKPFVIRDRELITGQNPSSDHEIAAALVKALRERAERASR
jgi:putative intracellular protease/amidase